MTGRITLAEHLADERRRHGAPDAELGALLEALAGAAQVLAREIRRAPLAGHVGVAGDRNVSGDVQKKLDVLGNDVVVGALAATGVVAAVVSEELAAPEVLAGDAGRHVVCTDPLDGSSNTDVNGAVGTIFGVWPRSRSGPLDPAVDVLRPGSEQTLAGYVMYGPATTLVYTAGRGTHGLTLDPDREAFVLSHPAICCPARGPYYSANVARAREWAPGVQRFVGAVTEPGPPAPGEKARSWSLRYTGALVADVHRSLLEGGIYFYPADRKQKDGKLRLLYECAPLAFVVEQAGGAASTGHGRVLDVRPTSLHQRVPLAIGSVDDVALFERCVRASEPG